MQFLFQHVHGHVGLGLGRSFLLGFGQRLLVDFLVLIQGDGINLHGHSRYHVGRFLIHDEVVEGFNIDGLVADDIGSDKLASTFLVKGLNRGIFNAWELSYNTLYLLQLDAETAYLDLSVAASHKLDIASGQIAHDVAGAVDAGILLLVSKGIIDKYLGGLFGTVQVAAAHLRTGNPQLTGSTHGQTVTLGINNIEANVFGSFANRNLLHFLVHQVVGDENS